MPRGLLSRHPWPAPALRGRAALYACLDDHLGIRVSGFLSRAECAALAAAVLAARADWIEAFGGEQFSLGRAYYTHLETDRASEYFAGAAASDALVERHLPGLQGRVLALFGALLGGEVRGRPGWCGPGVHVFPAGEQVAREGGVIHFDTEGLAAPQLAREAGALTVVIMLQRPAQGGGLRLWDVTYAGHDDPTPAELAARSALVIYEPGDALVVSSYRMHQIQPFGGALDRISLTAHAAEADDGAWEAWF